MELDDIKKGDILVVDYKNDGCWRHKKNYIIFIAAGEHVKITQSESGMFASIPTLVHVDLADELNLGIIVKQTIGFTIKAYANNIPFKPSLLCKPTVGQYRELMSKLYASGYKYNKRNKSVKIKKTKI